MLKNTQINRMACKKIAAALGELNAQVVYVGGAVVSVYIDDPSAEDVRPTKDIDITLEILSLSALEELRLKLNKKGFKQSQEDGVICRFRYEDIKVDVMATKAIGWAPANPWFANGYKHPTPVDIDGTQIHCLNLAYYLASKFSAFYNRGAKDARTSKDFEDIIYLFNHTSTLVDELRNADEEVLTYLRQCSHDILQDRNKQEAILGHLFYEDQQYRYALIIKKLEAI